MATKLLNSTPCKVFVDKLSWKTGRKELFNYFQQLGTVLHAHVNFDPETGLSRKVGFVIFKETETAERAKKMNHTLDGKHIRVKVTSRA